LEPVRPQYIGEGPIVAVRAAFVSFNWIRELRRLICTTNLSLTNSK
jgi:hypothetical protein